MILLISATGCFNKDNPKASRHCLRVTDCKSFRPRNEGVKTVPESTLEVSCESNGCAPRRSDCVAGEKAAEIDNVQDVTEVLSVNVDVHLHAV
jgi:hypothetical protein